MADTLDALRAQMPSELVRAAPSPVDPEGMLEIWYAP
jgi:hypothetical protein